MAFASTLEGWNIRSLNELQLTNKRVLVRVDFNVPLDAAGHVADDARIVAALPTIRAIQAAGGRVILASHLGRPKGKVDPKFSLEPVAGRLAELLDQEVLLPDDCVGDAAEHLVANQRAGQIVLLENLRFHASETANSEDFARRLAELCDVFVSDAFGAMHREHASVAALPRIIPDRAAGLLVEREIAFLSKLTGGAETPYVAILGGAKISDKIEVLERLLGVVDGLIIGGAMANTFLAAQGHAMGKSLVETDKAQLARHLLARCEERGIRVWLPVDHVVAGEASADAATEVVPVGAVGEAQMALDIGPETVELFSAVLDGSAGEGWTAPKTLFWNGPMGLFEIEPFAAGTMALARAVARAPATSVIGGGDSAAAARKAGVTSMISHISTGGGASLEFLGGRMLPGLVALRGGRR
ncbi:MAG: phosphoglycerate kinase [Deltaproteobacteria bacterium]|nr:phosphoglycerate kinase [Deltaproteobacteria bacterium]